MCYGRLYWFSSLCFPPLNLFGSSYSPDYCYHCSFFIPRIKYFMIYQIIMLHKRIFFGMSGSLGCVSSWGETLVSSICGRRKFRHVKSMLKVLAWIRPSCDVDLERRFSYAPSPCKCFHAKFLLSQGVPLHSQFDSLSRLAFTTNTKTPASKATIAKNFFFPVNLIKITNHIQREKLS